MQIVDGRLINKIVETPLDIDVLPIGVGLLVLTFGCVGLLMWVIRYE
mgnify:FL=1